MAATVAAFEVEELRKKLQDASLSESEKKETEEKMSARQKELEQLKSAKKSPGSIANPYSKSLYMRAAIRDVLSGDEGVSLIGETIVVGGWVKTGRTAEKGAFTFLEINDGSCPTSLQVLVKAEIENPDRIKQTGVCVVVEGELKAAPAESKQKTELHVSKMLHVGTCEAAAYPIAKSKLSLEFLREKIHLRVRTNTIAAIQRVRNCLAFATHRFFQESGFQYVHTPIITASDCEGAGEMFQITTMLAAAEEAGKKPPPTEEYIASLKAAASAAGSKVADIKKASKEGSDEDKEKAKQDLKPALDELMAAKKAVEEAEAAAKNVGGLPRTATGGIDYSTDFFGQPVNMTVSGQLQAEIYACAMTSVYTFGPTFRAENSHTSRHLAEFWMIEPEIAFADLFDVMQCAEDYVRYCCVRVLEECMDDLVLLSKMYDKGCIDRVRAVASQPFGRCSYTEAIEILKKAVANGHKFENNEIEWGMDMGSEHERYISEKVFKKPVCCYNYPKAIKAFYMRANEDGKTVASMDVLVPGVGELIGGSQREERYEVLVSRLEELNLDPKVYEWYTDLRKFGTCVHSGFGLGFERLILFCTGMENIRDVIPFPRWPGNARG
ncbi:hypothetical protein GUITHDRAFT_97505 [Guillardia theta CCMP2712]|uniref:asparagine--tRNA ligase n=2 Tax=Guillardia theta TaxID=55529 RepID=L1IKL5_GUITC|nr:hypothetical protein GUITHDRAFT_97505 [Guillardia theta CCMP2712]EKX36778.1 hypothetical protein GUITHDRAFT_97505 [Guillardia theta CCMP2712]|mmetsp:Transcript_8995/g.29988  ORF Transcript_8995/g.29988 Transcript_8995/m.29988 type:complete len:610 (+) Transcript_8995:1344-3173(+)|eukprot:XP_005823758.1 hypothetical protein GUITHDRAFT_97505 [Guillardia theta CCMP2712]